MGTRCCSQQFDNYEIKVQKAEVFQKQKRNWFPSLKIAIPMSKISEYEQLDLKEINKMVFKVSSYQKKFKTPYRINRQPIPENRIPQPYFLPNIGAFYVGEWVWNTNIDDNVPGGIGRLYQVGVISQGCFKTIFIPQNDTDLGLDKTDESLIPLAPHSLSPKGQNFSSNQNGTSSGEKEYQYLQRKLKQNQNISEGNIFIVKLHGQGRISQQQSTQQNMAGEEEQEIIQMDGDFYEGRLNGKGNLKITHKGIQKYLYSGTWKNGQKHGKGVEKVNTYKYQGDFSQNCKHGKGVQIFISSPKEQRQVQRDLQNFQRVFKVQGENIKIQALKKAAVRQYRQKMIMEQLMKQDYPGSKIQFSIQRTLILDSSFILERTHRKYFAQQYSGDFYFGKMEGFGIYVWSSGKTYKGKWVDNRLNGKGEFYWPDGSYFQGTYVDDERNGEGTMVWSVAKRYRGNWAFGFRHGYGESIEIDELNCKMTIKGSIWNKDQVKKKIFQKVIDLPDYNKIQPIENYVEEQMKNSGAPKSKDKENNLQLLSLIKMNESNLLSNFGVEI